MFTPLKLLKYLPEIKEVINGLKESGYKNIEKKVANEQIRVSGVSPNESKYTEIWDAAKDRHFVISEYSDKFSSKINELVRQNLNGNSLRIYSKSKETHGPIETILLYLDSPLMMYKRILNKTTGEKSHFKRKGEGSWERLWKPEEGLQVLPKMTEINGSRVKHNVVEKDNTISTYLLNTKTQNVYKRTTDFNGKHQYFKITSQGIINLFPKI